MNLNIACCSGFIDSGTPTGREEIIAGINCYVAEPSKYEAAIIIAPDIFGFTPPNPRLIADGFAKNDYYCILPDIFNGTEVPVKVMDDMLTMKSSTASWLSKLSSFGSLLYHFPPFILRNSAQSGMVAIEKIINHLGQKGVTKIAVQGYCWGGKIAVLLAQKPDLVDACCAAHPGGLKLYSDIERIVKPIYFVLPENDWQIKEKEYEKIKYILELKEKNDGVVHAVKWYLGMEHGFAVRGDENNENVRAQRQDAFKTAVEYFNKVFNINKN